jgi:hypothetical protein
MLPQAKAWLSDAEQRKCVIPTSFVVHLSLAERKIEAQKR